MHDVWCDDVSGGDPWSDCVCRAAEPPPRGSGANAKVGDGRVAESTGDPGGATDSKAPVPAGRAGEVGQYSGHHSMPRAVQSGATGDRIELSRTRGSDGI